MSGLVIGLVAGLVVGALLIFCCIRSICKEKSALTRQVKQVQQVDEDLCHDDVEAPTPPLEDAARVRPSAAATAGFSPKAKQQAMASAATAPIDDVLPTYDELEADAPSPAGGRGPAKTLVTVDLGSEGRRR
ncbi:unnamed protein product [Ectocarpus sp. 8 AP-2014]